MMIFRQKPLWQKKYLVFHSLYTYYVSTSKQHQDGRSLRGIVSVSHTRWFLRLGHSTSKFDAVIALFPRMKRVLRHGHLISTLLHLTFVNAIFSKFSWKTKSFTSVWKKVVCMIQMHYQFFQLGACRVEDFEPSRVVKGVGVVKLQLLQWWTS